MSTEGELKERIIATDESGFVVTSDKLPKGYFTSSRFLGSYFAICFALLCGASSFALIAPQLGVVNADIGPNKNYIWASYSYSTVQAVALPFVGRLSDIFGRRWFMVSGSVLGVIGAVVCARAQDIPTLIGGQVFLSLASATQFSFSFTLAEIVPTKYRYLSAIGLYIVAIPGGMLGALVSAAITATGAGWRGIYYTLIGFEVFSVFLWAFFYYPPTFHEKHGRDSIWKWIRNFDYIGSFLYTSGLVIFLFGLSSGGSTFPWSSAATICMIVLGFLALVAMGLYEWKLPSPESIAPIHIISQVSWLAIVINQGIAASAYYATAIVFPYQVGILYGNGDPLYAGILNCFPAIGNTSGLVTAGPFLARLPRHRYLMMGLFIVQGVLIACCALVTVDNKALILALVFLANYFGGWIELIGQINSGLVIKNQQELGIACGIGAAIRNIVIAVISVAYGTAFTNGMETKVPAIVGQALTRAGLPESSVPAFLQALSIGTPAALANVPGISATITGAGLAAYKVAVTKVFRVVYLVTITFSVLGVIISFFTANVEDLLNMKVAAQLHTGEGEELVAVKTREDVVHDEHISNST